MVTCLALLAVIPSWDTIGTIIAVAAATILVSKGYFDQPEPPPDEPK